MNFFQTIIFDVDSTLCTIEGIDELAKLNNVADKVLPLTQQAMGGDLTFDQVFSKRLGLIKPTKNNVDSLGSLYCQNLAPFVSQVISRLHFRKKEIYLVSGGYKEALWPLADLLGIQKKNVYANVLIFDTKGNYAGFDQANPLCRANGKREIISTLKAKKKVILVGDGMSDVEAKDAVDLFVGFGGVVTRKKVEQCAECYIKDMRDLLAIPGII